VFPSPHGPNAISNIRFLRPEEPMGAGASGQWSETEYEKYKLESSKRELKQAFLYQRAAGMDGEALFDHMAHLTERTLAPRTSTGSTRRKFNYPASHSLVNNVEIFTHRISSGELAPTTGGTCSPHWVENGDSRLSASLVRVDSMSLRNRHRPLRRAAMNDMIKLQENKLSII
jgi:hypothetical protein